MSRLVAHAHTLGLDLRIDAGDAAVLPDDDGVIGWFAGRRPPDRGDRLDLDGRRLVRRGPAARVRAGLVVIDDPVLAPAVSVADHLAAASSPSRASTTLAATPRLAGRDRDPAGVLSGGERRLLGWARAVLLEPRVVVLDRAGTGLDDDALAWTIARVAAWRATGTTVLVRAGRAEEAAWT